jgi:folate-binding protein YgfZ
VGSPDLRAGAPTDALVARGIVTPAERELLTRRAGSIARTGLARFRLTGSGRLACLQGLVTCDVDKPGDDSHLFGALLDAKGAIVTPLWIYRLPDALVVEVPEAAAAEVESVWERSLPPKLCRYEVTTAATASIGVYGPMAGAALAAAVGVPEPPAVGRLAKATVGRADAPLVAARIAARGLDGFECLVPAAAAQTLAARLVDAGAPLVSAALLEERRILSGFPRLGAEIDEKTLPQEVRLDELGAVSYTKGCYLGQETVARVHFRGHVNRHLVGVALERLTGAPPLDVMDGGRRIGRVTSACWWEAGQRYAALAVIRRDAAPGSAVQLADGAISSVRELPFEPQAGGEIA